MPIVRSEEMSGRVQGALYWPHDRDNSIEAEAAQETAASRTVQTAGRRLGEAGTTGQRGSYPALMVNLPEAGIMLIRLRKTSDIRLKEGGTLREGAWGAEQTITS